MKLGTLILAGLCLITGWWYGTAFSMSIGIGLKQGIVTDLFPFWNGCHAVLHSVDPYSQQITLENEIEAFGTTASNLGTTTKERQFAYPAFAAFATFPIGLAPFSTANQLAPWVFGALIVLSVGWWRGKWDRRTVTYILLALGTYPLVFSLQSRQPTLLFLGLAVAAYALFSCDQLIWAGIVAGLSCGKPHVALAILLPMLIQSARDLTRRRAFPLSFIASLGILMLLATAATPGWFIEWLGALRAYSKHAAGPSVVAIMFGGASIIVSPLLCISLLVVLWFKRNASLRSEISLSIVIFQLVLPWEFYNTVALLLVIIWTLDNPSLGNPLILALLRVSLVEYWIATGVGAALLYSSEGKDVALRLPVIMLNPIIATASVAVFWPWLREHVFAVKTRL